MTTLLAKIQFRVAQLKDERAAGAQFCGPANAAAASPMSEGIPGATGVKFFNGHVHVSVTGSDLLLRARG